MIVLGFTLGIWLGIFVLLILALSEQGPWH